MCIDFGIASTSFLVGGKSLCEEIVLAATGAGDGSGAGGGGGKGRVGGGGATGGRVNGGGVAATAGASCA